MKLLNILGTVILGLALSLSGCTKDPEIGPEGPQGEQGDQGPKGPPGDAGEDGESGSADIIRSEWIEVDFTGTARLWTGTIDAPEITQDILDRAEISVYFKDGSIHELNYFTDANNIVMQVALGRIVLKSTFNASGKQFRYVLIPGGSKN